MRISKLLMPAVTLAGALALAGCGGGSSTTGAGTDPGEREEGDMMPSADNDGYVIVDATLVPGGYDLLDEDENDKGQIRSGGIGEWLGRDGTKLEVTCNDDDGCLWRVRNGQLQVTGDFEPKRIDPAPPSVENTATATDHGETGLGWLSAASLVEAVRDDRRVELKRGNVRHTVGIGTGNTIQPIWTAAGDVSTLAGDRVIDVTGGRDIDVRLIHTRGRAGEDGEARSEGNARADDYLVFGSWEMRARSGVDGRDPQAGVMWAGSIPYVGVESYSTGTATYEGQAFGHYKHNATGDVGASANWTEWDGTSVSRDLWFGVFCEAPLILCRRPLSVFVFPAAFG